MAGTSEAKTVGNVVALDSEDDNIIARALSILERRIRKADFTAGSPNVIKQYLICKLASEEREIFSILWLDVKNRLIQCERLFFGTLTQCSIYPREVVISGLRVNAAAAVLVHNHPSGEPEPSQADFLMTRALCSALSLVDIRVLDHIIVASRRTHSFAEHGEI